MGLECGWGESISVWVCLEGLRVEGLGPKGIDAEKCAGPIEQCGQHGTAIHHSRINWKCKLLGSLFSSSSSSSSSSRWDSEGAPATWRLTTSVNPERVPGERGEGELWDCNCRRGKNKTV